MYRDYITALAVDSHWACQGLQSGIDFKTPQAYQEYHYGRPRVEVRGAVIRELVVLLSTLKPVVALTDDNLFGGTPVFPVICLFVTSCLGASDRRRTVRSRLEADGWVIRVRAAVAFEVALARPVITDEAVVEARWVETTELAVDDTRLLPIMLLFVLARLAGAAIRDVLDVGSLIPIEAKT